MPCYLVTLHAYRSWSEDHDRGYIQHDRGLSPSDRGLAKWRADRATQPPARFEAATHDLLHDLARTVTHADEATLHAVSVTPTHVHLLLSFATPACCCPWREAAGSNPSSSAFCGKSCDARKHAHKVAVHLKRVAGGRLSQQTQQPGRKWFSRGEDITPIRDRKHYLHHIETYLPKHRREAGTVKVYGDDGPPATPRIDIRGS
jgi:hypothetical protein